MDGGFIDNARHVSEHLGHRVQVGAETFVIEFTPLCCVVMETDGVTSGLQFYWHSTQIEVICPNRIPVIHKKCAEVHKDKTQFCQQKRCQV